MKPKSLMQWAAVLILLVITAETGCLKNVTPVFPYATSTPTLSNTPTFSLTHTPTNTPTRAFDPTPINTNPFTSTPTITPNSSTVPTLTPTVTPTQTFTPTVTITCTTTSYLGDVVPSGTQIGVFGSIYGTYAQRYDLAQAGVVQSIWIEPIASAAVKVGIYTGNDNDNWPETLLYESSKVTVSGLSSISVPNINLPAGAYWLAYEDMDTAPDLFEGASGSTAQTDIAHELFFPTIWSICLTATPAPTPVCTPPTYSATNQILIYAQICH